MNQETIPSEVIDTIPAEGYTYISISDCLKEAHRLGIFLTKPTIQRIIQERGIGWQPNGPGGKWFVNKEKFMKFIKEAP